MYLCPWLWTWGWHCYLCASLTRRQASSSAVWVSCWKRWLGHSPLTRCIGIPAYYAAIIVNVLLCQSLSELFIGWQTSKHILDHLRRGFVFLNRLPWGRAGSCAASLSQREVSQLSQNWPEIRGRTEASRCWWRTGSCGDSTAAVMWRWQLVPTLTGHLPHTRGRRRVR